MTPAPGEGLVGALLACLRRGHRRVACRRYLILQACGNEVPARKCERLLARRSGRGLAKMRNDTTKAHYRQTIQSILGAPSSMCNAQTQRIPTARFRRGSPSA